MIMPDRAVFLDKDGTIVEDVPFNTDVKKIRFLPGVEEGLRILHTAGFRLFIVTNQAGIARGYCTEDDVSAVGRFLAGSMSAMGVSLSGFYYCPHFPDGTEEKYAVPCPCRKPEPGLIYSAARDHGIALEKSWVVGDILDDVEAGRRSGCRTVFIDHGKETEWVLSRERIPDHIVDDFLTAAEVIVACSRQRAPGGHCSVGQVSSVNVPEELKTKIRRYR